MSIKKQLDQHRQLLTKRLLIAFLLAGITCVFFLFYDALAAWQIIAKLRFIRLVSLVIVAISLTLATILFQVVTRNRILSPNVMGFDSVFSLVATATVFFLSSQVANKIPVPIMFLVQAGLMTLVAVTLFMSLLKRKHTSIHFMVLIGLVAGQFLRSLTRMMVSIMDPNEYLNVLDTSTASFSIINQPSLVITLIVSCIIFVLIYRYRYILDVMAQGYDVAINLGLNYYREVKVILTYASILVACATALVGPLMFFGLLMANVSIYYLGSTKMAYYLPTAAFLSISVLVGGQGILEHVLHQATILPVVLEFVGGVLLLILIVKEAKK